MTIRGVVRAGRIEVVEGPPLPEGATVEIEVRSVTTPAEDPTLEVFGMWADRTDLGDSREWVERLRERQWQR